MESAASVTIRVILQLTPVKDRSFLPQTRDQNASRRHKFVKIKPVSKSTELWSRVLTMYTLGMITDDLLRVLLEEYYRAS